MKSYYNIIETLVGIYTVENGRLLVLLKKKQEEPYRNHWIMPGNIVSKTETLEECAKNIVIDNTGLSSIFLTQNAVFSELNRDPDERIIACSFSALTIKEIISVQSELKWFDISELPRMGYDHNIILNKNIKYLKRKIIYNEDGILFKLFPGEFTLSDFQTFYEIIFGKQFDKRNFRKKVIMEGTVIETGYKKTGKAGRPGKLYKLNSKLGEGSII